MNRWEEEFENNPLPETLKEARVLLDVKIKDIDAAHELEKRRISKIIDLTEELIAGLDSEVLPIDLMNQINNHFRHAGFWNEISAYNSNPAVGNLTNANNHINAILPVIFQLGNSTQKVSQDKTTKLFGKAFDDFAELISSKSKEFSEQLDQQAAKQDELEANSAQLAANIDAKKLEIDTLISEWQTQFTDDQNTRSTEFTDAQVARKTGFANVQAEREVEHDQWKKSFQSTSEQQITKLMQSSSTTLDKHNASFKEALDGYKKEAKESHDAILDLHGLVAGDSVAAGYLTNADTENEQANFWRKVAIGFIVATAVWIGGTYFFGPEISSDGSLLWGKILKATTLAGVLLYGAVYASKQSSFHRNNEKRTRWFALEIKAIDPFIASLEKVQQKELKQKLSERLFGQNNQENGPSSPNVDANMLKIIIEAVRDVVKTGK